MVEARYPTILITGGAGFIGERLATRLISDSYPVVVFDINIPSQILPSSVDFIQADLRDKKKTTDLVRRVKPNIVVHLANRVGARGYLHTFENAIYRDNKAMDETLYAALEESDVNVGLVEHASSSMVYENATTYPYTESQLPFVPWPTNKYGQAKRESEIFPKQSGFPFIITRYHNVYGPDEKPKGQGPGDRHVIPAVIEKVREGLLPLRILGNPFDTRPFTYIDDAVEATIRLLYEGVAANPKVINQDFNIGPRKANDILSLYQLAWNLSGSPQIFDYVTEDIAGTTAHRREMDPTKIHEAIGWEPTIPLEEGLIRVDPLLVNIHA